MALGATRTDIANLALILIGEQPIMDIENPTDKQGRTCKAMFDFAKQAAFNEHPWACLLKRTALAADAVLPAFEFDYSFTLPSDCIRLYRILDPESGDPIEEKYKVEGNKVLCSYDAPLYIQYVADTDNFGLLHPHVYDVLAHTLAERISIPVTGKATIYNAMSRKLKELVDSAVFIDSTVDTPPDPQGVDYYGDSRSA
jgi:hypothetical protein